MPVQTVTLDEARSFANKLEDFASTLSPAERDLLLEILYRAAMADEDVEGHASGRQTIAATVVSLADMMGLASQVSPALTAGAATGHAQASRSQVLVDDKGGIERIPSQ